MAMQQAGTITHVGSGGVVAKKKKNCSVIMAYRIRVSYPHQFMIGIEMRLNNNDAGFR